VKKRSRAVKQRTAPQKHAGVYLPLRRWALVVIALVLPFFIVGMRYTRRQAVIEEVRWRLEELDRPDGQEEAEYRMRLLRERIDEERQRLRLPKVDKTGRATPP
jgi:hypothetical protein